MRATLGQAAGVTLSDSVDAIRADLQAQLEKALAGLGPVLPQGEAKRLAAELAELPEVDRLKQIKARLEQAMTAVDGLIETYND